MADMGFMENGGELGATLVNGAFISEADLRNAQDIVFCPVPA